MATELQEKVRGQQGKGLPSGAAPAPASAPPKLADAAVSATGEVVPLQAAQGAPAPADLEALRAENASLQARLNAFLTQPPSRETNKQTPAFGTQPLRPVDPTVHAQAGEPDRRLGIGMTDTGDVMQMAEPKDGRQCWLVGLPGLKSRVVDPERGVAVQLDQLPVWARNKGEAQMLFYQYNGVCATVQQPTFVLVE
jgi:hypothetical protein